MTSGSIDGRWDAMISSTSAPCAASVRPHTGPAAIRLRSRTLTPATGRSAGTRSMGRAQGHYRRSADRLDGEERKAGDRAAVVMLITLGERPARGRLETGVGGGGLERLAAPFVERALDCDSIMTAAEQGK